MTVHSERRHVPHGADAMFALVADVESYPRFLPWCTDTRILAQDTRDGVTVTTADLIVSFKAFRESFRSQVTADPAARRIDIEYIKGPFRYLNNRWRFEDNGDGTCTIDFFIDFEFKSRILQTLMSSVFELAGRRMVKAFEQRADDLYGVAG